MTTTKNTKRFHNGLAPSTLYRLGMGYSAYGVIRDEATGDKLFDFYRMTGLVSDQQRQALLAIAPDVQFKQSRAQYAPEQCHILVCFPKAAWYRRQTVEA